MEMVLYARKEPTTDPLTVGQRVCLVPVPRDVVIYRDPAAQERVARYVWYFGRSKPTRRNRWLMHNCARYRLVWLADA